MDRGGGVRCVVDASHGNTDLHIDGIGVEIVTAGVVVFGACGCRPRWTVCVHCGTRTLLHCSASLPLPTRRCGAWILAVEVWAAR